MTEQVRTPLYIDATYRRRVRIVGSQDALHGFKVYVYDLDTGQEIENVCAAAIYLCPGELNRADLTYYKHNAQGNIELDMQTGLPISGIAHSDNPEIAVSCYERGDPYERR